MEDTHILLLQLSHQGRNIHWRQGFHQTQRGACHGIHILILHAKHHLLQSHFLLIVETPTAPEINKGDFIIWTNQNICRMRVSMEKYMLICTPKKGQKDSPGHNLRVDVHLAQHGKTLGIPLFRDRNHLPKPKP